MVPQLSVFLQNRSGKLAAITRALSDSGVDIRALSIADTTAVSKTHLTLPTKLEE